MSNSITVNSVTELRQFIGQSKKRALRQSFLDRFQIEGDEQAPLADWELELLGYKQIDVPEREREIIDISGQL